MKRFVSIRAPKGRVRHIITEKLVEGSSTKCGLLIQKGWKWTSGRLSVGPVCRRCA